MNLGLKKAEVRVVAHDPGWAKAFEEEKAELLRLLGAAAVTASVEHIGGTSIPNLPSKPIIDIAIGLADGAQVSKALEVLLGAGREYIKGANQPGMLFMARGDPRKFHYHLVVIETPAWRKLIDFRNHLRRHPGLAAEYGNMKKVIAERFPHSRLDYMRYKRPMLRAILARAFGEARRRRHAMAIRQSLAVEAGQEKFGSPELADD